MNQQESFIARFLRQESAGGIILMLAAVLAMIAANSPLEKYYALLLDTPVAVQVGALVIAKPLLLWINDGLMAVFFFLVGLELKRELVQGELSQPSQIMLPAIGAIGGMAAPALIYSWFNWGDSVAMQGWAIPAATDIAFALGVLFLLGSRVPVSIKIFLTSLAIFDDIGAIVIIALFYTDQISTVSLMVAVVCILTAALLNMRGVESKSMYVAMGVVMWVAMLKSGVHATLAGIVIAMFIPLKSKQNPESSPLKELEHDLHSMVAYWVLPVFAFANAGISFAGMGMDQVLHGVPVGIALGLFLGKQIGIFGLCGLAIKLRMAQLPTGMTWTSLYGTAALCGIGFTMSLFIGSLAFEDTGQLFDERLGIVMGSLISGVVGYLVLNVALPKKTQN